MAVDTDTVELVGDEVTENLARAVVFAAVTAATAPVSVTIPVSSVPVTLQTLWVYLAGLFLGPVWAGVAFVLYLLAGALGLPVFAGGASGIGVLLGPTGGFLVGFVVAGVATGAVAHGRRPSALPGELSALRLGGAAVTGAVVVFAVGAVGFALVQNVGLGTAVTTAVLPFLPGDAVKIVAAVAIARSDVVAAR